VISRPRQHYGMMPRIQVQDHDVPHLLHEERIGGKFEGLAAVRLSTHGTISFEKNERERPSAFCRI
jgi:hypothetical protein